MFASEAFNCLFLAIALLATSDVALGRSSFEGEMKSSCTGYWIGTAPFCNSGACDPGYHAAGTSTSGDGATCWLGYKVFCACGGTGGGLPPPDQCVSGTTQTACAGLVLICNDGCDTTVCGACLGIWGFGWVSVTEPATGRLIGLKNSTKEEIHGLITAADPDQLRLALAKLDYILPVGTSDAYVRSFASNVADRAFDNLKYIDAAGSYHNWHNPGRWIPSKKWKEDEKIIRDPPIVVKDSDYAEL